MKLHLWGTDFRRSPADMRSRLCLAPEDREAVMRELLELGFSDLVYLSTCNRVELYTTAGDHFCDTRGLWLSALNRFGLEEEDFYRGYHLEGKSALRHLMRVASSLESLVVGEPQILGQLKEALQWSKANGFPVDASLERSFRLAFETAKRVRTETAIGEKPVSVASLGLSYVEHHEQEVPLERAVIVGRGPISLIVAQWLQKNRPTCPITWVNRTVSALADIPEARTATKISLDDFLRSAPVFSHLFTATSSPQAIFRGDFLARLAPNLKLILDFAQPPDVETCECLSKEVRLIHLEDLTEEAKQNAASRAIAVRHAERIIESSLREYCLEQKEAPVLRAFNRMEPLSTELEEWFTVIESEFPAEIQAKLKRLAEKMMKRSLHVSREHLRTVLRRVSDSDEAPHLRLIEV